MQTCKIVCSNVQTHSSSQRQAALDANRQKLHHSANIAPLDTIGQQVENACSAIWQIFSSGKMDALAVPMPLMTNNAVHAHYILSKTENANLANTQTVARNAAVVFQKDIIFLIMKYVVSAL